MVCVLRRVIPVLFLVISVPIFAQTQSSSTRPPKNLHLVGDHWTPYNPPDPATFPPNAKVHVIARGDTLWDLAQQYYGNAYLWPQLWEQNTYITDAHWIYPGDPLLVQGETASGEVETDTTVAEGGGSQDVTTELTPVVPAPTPLGGESDIYCTGYLGHPDEPLPNRVSSYEDTDTKYLPLAVEQVASLTVGEIFYVEGGTATGLVAGDTYIVVRPEELIRHPRNKKEIIGRHYDYKGRIRILCASEDRATALVVQQCKAIILGDRLKPIPQHPIPLVRRTPMVGVCTPASGKASGFIVNSDGFVNTIGIGTVVEINLGADDLLQPGDFLTVYRENAIVGHPRQVLGEIGILTSDTRTATAKVVNMRYDMRVGDRVEVK